MTVFERYTIMVIRTEHLIPALSVFTCILHWRFTSHSAWLFTSASWNNHLAAYFVGLFRRGVGRDELLMVWPMKQSDFLFGSQPFAISRCRLCSNSFELFLCQLLFYKFVRSSSAYTCDQAPLFAVEVRQRALGGLFLLLFVAFVRRAGLVLLPTQWLWTSRVAWVEPRRLTLFWFCLRWFWLFSLVNGYFVYGCTMTFTNKFLHYECYESLHF